MKQDPSRRRRSVAKALTWRILSTAVTGTLAYLFFGDWSTCGMLMVCDFVFKFFLYYYHERFWHQVNWGKQNV